MCVGSRGKANHLQRRGFCGALPHRPAPPLQRHHRRPRPRRPRSCRRAAPRPISAAVQHGGAQAPRQPGHELCYAGAAISSGFQPITISVLTRPVPLPLPGPVALGTAAAAGGRWRSSAPIGGSAGGGGGRGHRGHRGLRRGTSGSAACARAGAEPRRRGAGPPRAPAAGGAGEGPAIPGPRGWASPPPGAAPEERQSRRRGMPGGVLPAPRWGLTAVQRCSRQWCGFRCPRPAVLGGGKAQGWAGG